MTEPMEIDWFEIVAALSGHCKGIAEGRYATGSDGKDHPGEKEAWWLELEWTAVGSRKYVQHYYDILQKMCAERKSVVFGMAVEWMSHAYPDDTDGMYHWTLPMDPIMSHRHGMTLHHQSLNALQRMMFIIIT